MNRITHFEFATDDPEKTAAFYREVFGWKIQKWDGPVDYWLVTTGDQNTIGINGGLMATDDTFRGTINTIQVDDIDAAIAKIQANGGQIVLDKDAIPGVGYQAYFKDNSGIIVGVHQNDPNAGMGGCLCPAVGLHNRFGDRQSEAGLAPVLPRPVAAIKPVEDVGQVFRDDSTPVIPDLHS